MYLGKRATPYVEKQLGSVEGLETVTLVLFPWEYTKAVHT
jgi:hypothetical protein